MWAIGGQVLPAAVAVQALVLVRDHAQASLGIHPKVAKVGPFALVTLSL